MKPNPKLKTSMTPEEYGQRNARDAALAHQKAEDRYGDNSSGYAGPYIVGFRDGMDAARSEMDTLSVVARLDNARKLEVENAKLRQEIERLKRLDFCPEEEAAGCCHCGGSEHSSEACPNQPATLADLHELKKAIPTLIK